METLFIGEDFLLSLISNNLFPIFITLFLLLRFEKTIQKMIEMIQKMSQSISNLDNTLSRIEENEKNTKEEIKEIRHNQESLIRKLAGID